MNELRLVQVIPYLRYGGLERVATLLTIALQRRGAHVAVCSSGGEPFAEELRAAGVPLVEIPRPRARPARLVHSAFALSRVLRRERPALVHAHNPAAAAVAGVARRLARLPGTAIVTTYHGVPPEQFERAAWVLARFSDVVVGVGPAVTESLREAGLTNAVTIYNAVEAEAARPAEAVRREFGAEDSELVVTVGRYMVEKNQLLLLDALAELAPRRPRLRALIVGYGPLEDELKARIATLGLQDVAEITGERHDVYDLMHAADCFALSSDREALPLVVIEAMKLGCPVVSTDLLGVRDLVSEGVTGLLVPPRNPSALAAAIGHVLDDRELAARLSKAAKALVEERCSVDTMVSEYEHLYERAIRARAPSPST